MKTNIVFVCKGNVCRSAIAEILMKHHLQIKYGDNWHDKYIVQSGGTTPGFGKWGSKMAPKMRKIAIEHDLDKDLVNSHKAKPVTEEMLTAGDINKVFIMDNKNLTKMLELFPTQKVEFLDKSVITDPFGKDEEHFMGCFDFIDEGCTNYIYGDKV